MFCGKCGSTMDDNVLICPECGAPVEAEKAAEVSVGESEFDETVRVRLSVEENVESEDEVVSEYMDSDSLSFELNTEGNDDTPKKKKQLPVIVGGIAALLATIVVCFIFLWSQISGTFDWVVLSPEKNLEKVYQKAVSDAFDGGSEFLGTIGSVDITNLGYEGEISISADEMIMELLSSAVGADLSWVDGATIGYDASVLDKLAKLTYNVKVNNTDIINAQQIIDFNSMEQWLSIPAVSDNALYSASEYSYDDIISYDVNFADQYAAIFEAVPSQEVLERITQRYVGLIINGFGTVDKSADAVNVNGLEQRLRILTATMDQDDIVDMALNVLETLKEDQDIKDIFTEFETITGEDYYVFFIEELDNLIIDIEDAADAGLPEVKFILVTYLNNSNEIVGMSFTGDADGEEIELVRWLRVIKGKKFASEFVVSASSDAEIIRVDGKGEVNKKMSADFVVHVDETEIFTVQLFDYVNNETESSGKMKIIPTKEIVEGILYLADVDSTIASLISSQNFVLEIKFSGNQTSSKVEYSLLADNEALISLSVSANEKKPSAIEKPQNVVDEFSEAELDDLNAELRSNFKEAGMPEELLDMFFPLEDIPVI